MPTRPLPARMAVIRAEPPAPRPCDDPAHVPACWLRPCARCGGETAVAMDPGCEQALYLCTEPGCGAATNEDGVVVDIAPAAWGGTDTVRDVAHEMERERPSALERAETRADDRHTGGRKLDYLY